ncbi:MAG: hypothetical protein AAF411_13180 [Myxococcota bacterium]
MTSWVFDALPPSGARRGGNPAEHAFRQDLATFVREVVQNANDQAQLRPRVHFRFESLENDAKASFLAAMDWPALRTHLHAAGELAHGHRLREGLARADGPEPLRLLFIDDFGTDGLTGGEDEEHSHFRALCKDTLVSHKGETAGGSYGLGKSVLWAFSELSTVLFCSTLIETYGERNPRLIGRTELASHRTAGRWYQGAGWFGARRTIGAGKRAESLWGQQAEASASALGFRSRADHDPGTSICVVAFNDPTTEGQPSLEDAARLTREAATRYFWPSLGLPRRALRVSTSLATRSTEHIRSDALEVQPFTAAWAACLAKDTKETLEQPGDVAHVSIPLRLPACDAHEAIEGRVALIVRLAERPGPWTGHLAMFRGPGMVVNYRDRSRIALGMRPFHALLACGLARDPVDVNPSDEAVETFLRAAEPPSHDRWSSTPRLKSAYRRGYAKALRELFERADAALAHLVVPARSTGEAGPKRLQRRFPIGKQGAVEPRANAFAVRTLKATREGIVWRFEAELERTIGRRPWRVALKLSEIDESARIRDALPIAELSCSEDIDWVSDGAALHLSIPKTCRTVRLRGRSAPASFLGALELEVVGEDADGR